MAEDKGMPEDLDEADEITLRITLTKQEQKMITELALLQRAKFTKGRDIPITSQQGLEVEEIFFSAAISFIIEQWCSPDGPHEQVIEMLKKDT